MCGIAGFYNPKENFSDNPKSCFKILTNMIKSMRMRGPDDEHFSIIKSCCLAHTRLSIIDIDNGRQPLKLTKNEHFYYIVYNGEVYNHIEIKNELISLGYTFSTNSDTEVLLTAFIHYGPLFVRKLNGIFAIAIYDESRNTLYLFRDHFGIKPLYYTTVHDTVVFASRIDTLFEYPRVKPCLDVKGFNEIFTIGPAKTYGCGVFTNINEVLPGEYITISPGAMSKRIYYKPESHPHTDDYETSVETVKYLVCDSIKKQMISDVPICTFLSGGLDSSLVTAVCCKNMNPSELSTYSFDFTDNDKHYQANAFQPSQDRPYVDIMVKYLGTNHTYLTCNYNELADLLYASVDSRCLPTMADVDSSLLYFCSEVAKNHKVTLTGECADEIFGGYPWFHREEMIKANTFPWMSDISFRKSLLHPEFAAVLQMEKYIAMSYEKTISEVEILPDESELDEARRKITYLNIRYFMQTLLDRMDRTSMHSGLEARVPFADRRIVDYLYNLPWEMKSKDGVPKNILRIAAADYLPDEVLNRPKNPYPKTYHPGYEKILNTRLREIIHDTSSPLRSYLNLSAVERFLDSPMEYGKPWYGQLMAGPQMMAYLIQIDYWMRKYGL